MSKRKAPDEDVWFVLQEDGVLHTVAKSKKEALSTEGMSPTLEYVQTKKIEESENSYVNASDNESGIVYEEDNFIEDFNEGDTNDVSGTPTLPQVVRTSTGCKWPTEAVWRLLDIIESKSNLMESTAPNKRTELWMEVADEMKPFEYTREDCHRKYKGMKHMYQKLVRRKALDMFPVQWKFFRKMAVIMGDDDMPTEDTSGDEDNVPVEVRCLFLHFQITFEIWVMAYVAKTTRTNGVGN